ncbi:MAG: glucose-6-phosphate dehydrogenase, partial [Gammaproteobacteria bacterium]
MTEQQPDIVLFGGFGDLALRKLLPALFNLFASGELPPGSRILLVAREPLTRAQMQERIGSALSSPSTDAWRRQGGAFLQHLQPVTLALGSGAEDWSELAELLGAEPARVRVYYLALPPALFQTACDGLARTGLISRDSRLVIEKPIGHDRGSAAGIVDGIARHFSEDRVYRIDHYLGKEAVQNLMVLRFSNTLFETLWCSQSIESVQITLAETVGLEGRVSFYDG